MPLKHAQIVSFLADFFSDLKLTLQPENKQLYDRFSGNIPVPEILHLKYFSKQHVDEAQIVKAVRAVPELLYDAEHYTFTRTRPPTYVSLDAQTLLFSGLESSNFPTINRDIKWYIAKLTGVFPKFTAPVSSRVFGPSKFVARIVFESEAAARKVFEHFGAQPAWDQQRIAKSGEFFESKAWKTVKVAEREKYVDRMLSHKEEIGAFIVCLQYAGLHLSFPPGLVAQVTILGAEKRALCAWFHDIAKFIFSEYEGDVFRVLLCNLPGAASIFVAKHLYDGKIVQFAHADAETERAMWAKCVTVEREKHRL